MAGLTAWIALAATVAPGGDPVDALGPKRPTGMPMTFVGPLPAIPADVSRWIDSGNEALGAGLCESGRKLAIASWRKAADLADEHERFNLASRLRMHARSTEQMLDEPCAEANPRAFRPLLRSEGFEPTLADRLDQLEAALTACDRFTVDEVERYTEAVVRIRAALEAGDRVDASEVAPALAVALACTQDARTQFPLPH